MWFRLCRGPPPARPYHFLQDAERYPPHVSGDAAALRHRFREGVREIPKKRPGLHVGRQILDVGSAHYPHELLVQGVHIHLVPEHPFMLVQKQKTTVPRGRSTRGRGPVPPASNVRWDPRGPTSPSPFGSKRFFLLVPDGLIEIPGQRVHQLQETVVYVGYQLLRGRGCC